MKKEHLYPLVSILVLTGVAATALLTQKIYSEKKKATVVCIPQGQNEYWDRVRKGAEDAAKVLDFKMIWDAPEREIDFAGQIKILEKNTGKVVSGILLAPNHSRKLVPAVETLAKIGMPCVIIDSGIDTEKITSFVGTDNYKGGVAAARRMGRSLNGKGNIVLIRYMPDSEGTEKRENGFIETIRKEFPDIKIVDMQYSLDTVETAFETGKKILADNKDKNIKGIFAPNLISGLGMLKALRAVKSRPLKLVVFDADKEFFNGMRDGYIDSVIEQDPYKIGYDGMMQLGKAVRREKVDKRINVDVKLIPAEDFLKITL